MSELIVELSRERIGRLLGDRRTFDFHADPEALQRYGIDSTALSVAVPLAAVAARGQKRRRQNFFQELLPEGRMRERLARDAGVQVFDSIGLLRTHGRDVAGALQIWDPEAAGEPRQPRFEPLDDAGVARMLERVQEQPLGNRGPGGKTSLAGVQDKIVLARTDDRWARVIDGAPSTHILKPASSSQATIIYDEAFGQAVVREIGISDFETEIIEFAGVPALVIERYDRSPSMPDGRIHQEDGNQALGASGDEKYQRLGGRVSLQRIAAVLRQHASSESVRQLARMTVAAAAVGNLDMHAKNISLVHATDGEIVLAPAYDFVPLAHHATDGELALSVAGEYRHAAVTAEHLVAELASWGLLNPTQIMEGTLDSVESATRALEPDRRAHPGMVDDIRRFTTNLLDGRAVGAE